jgi:hypothetical protein
MQAADTFEEIGADSREPALLAFRPQSIDARKRLAAEQRKRTFEKGELLVTQA